jgi:hypothetical protein
MNMSFDIKRYGAKKTVDITGASGGIDHQQNDEVFF